MRSPSLIDLDATTAKVPLFRRADTYEQVRRTLDEALADLEQETELSDLAVRPSAAARRRSDCTRVR
jgi:hypothetical protein